MSLWYFSRLIDLWASNIQALPLNCGPMKLDELRDRIQNGSIEFIRFEQADTSLA
ncbi:MULTISPECIES: hypothetical protein [unclassified Leptolyngbya]|uniref:hypothetical protein n=1 Tax=unclassified Leptolyngbya TaxID=2650499 RepID=UPI00168782AF|nr:MULTISPECIES: hypothetical protein [unclassified Leptolyngbya]MBD1909916.1 hypothetical protein [Leptolyngbya sp. FACHB-8]MBD2158620.1 hypothetical protein [Leptolyngbya sp. FACHB-16]